MAARSRSPQRIPSTQALPRQRIGPELEPDRLAGGSLPALHVEGRAGADGGPETAPLPARLRVVDPAVQPLRGEPHRLRDTEDYPLGVASHVACERRGRDDAASR